MRPMRTNAFEHAVLVPNCLLQHSLADDVPATKKVAKKA